MDSSARGNSRLAQRARFLSQLALARETALAQGQAASPWTRPVTRGRSLLYELLHTRPEFVKDSKSGTSGRSVALSANYFRVKKSPTWTIFKYRVEFSPPVDLIVDRKRLFKVHRDTFKSFLFNGFYFFTSSRLENTQFRSQLPASESAFVINCHFEKEVLMTDEESLDVLNLILKSSMHGLKLHPIGRVFYDPNAAIHLNDFHLDLWPGYLTSIRQYESDILLNVEITTRLVRRESVLEVFMDCLKHERDFKGAFEKEVVGSTVVTSYNNRAYRVDEVDWEASPASDFQTKSGASLKYMDYYERKYGIKIRDAKQPLLISFSREKDDKGQPHARICIIPELCKMMGLTPDMRSNFKMMSALAEHTRLKPPQRMDRLLTFNERLQKSVDSMKMLTEWDLELDTELVQFSGRELQPERIRFQNGEASGSQMADWTRDIINNKMHSSRDLRNWHVITSKKCENEIRTFIRVMEESVRGLGLKIAEPIIKLVPVDSIQEISPVIDRIVNEGTQLIMVVAMNDSEQRYAGIKKKCFIEHAVPSQVVLLKNIKPRPGKGPESLRSVATKVGIQLTCKLGGIPWFIHFPLTEIMVIGFDVARDSKDRGTFYGALVSALHHEPLSVSFQTSVFSYKNDSELCSGLKDGISKALADYQKQFGKLPPKIIFYRNGVGQGQTKRIIDTELQAFKVALEREFGDLKLVRFCYIIVCKNLNTRIFKGTRNPAPGTVIDSCITYPERYDFLLVPQNVNQGTATPTYYNIVEDCFFLSPDKLQILTFKLCHLYFNWSGTVRVPAVCQYATKCVTLVSRALHQVPHEELSDKLYFL